MLLIGAPKRSFDSALESGAEKAPLDPATDVAIESAGDDAAEDDEEAESSSSNESSSSEEE